MQVFNFLDQHFININAFMIWHVNTK